MFRPHIFNQIYIYYKVLHTKNTKCHFLWKIFMFGSQILDMFDILDFQCFLHICCLACWLTKHQIASSEGGVTVFQNLALSPLPPQSGWPNKRCWGLQSRRKKEAGQKIRMQEIWIYGSFDNHGHIVGKSVFASGSLFFEAEFS